MNEWWWKPLADERVLHPTPWKLKLLFGELDGISIGDVSFWGLESC